MSECVLAERPLTLFSRWSYAAKPKSWPKLLVPMLLGQGLGAFVAGQIDGSALVFGVLFVLADLFYIVFLNDWADAEVDAIKRRMFPDGCSPKTIPDGILPARALFGAGLLAGGVGLAVAFVFGHVLARPLLFPGALVSIGVFWAYTLPPLRLNYRGGGELLEALGVGVILPWLNAYAQAGSNWSDAYLALGPFALLSLGSAIASGLADERSDIAGGKTTVASTWGNARARQTVEICVLLGVLGWVLLPLTGSSMHWSVPFVAAAVALAFVPRLRARTKNAVTNAFREQALYKQELHRAIWWSASSMAILLAALTQVN